ncbi:MAG: 3-isopropylmalate dehydratase large subunit [Candidatus Cloacimonetes bacterium]|nr:3-isopropylmalate dehydratase large subunit [Candidatus Cloacimonadota bacterium]MBS3766579.1 3-isopropylmalate dehydratase large subunit [Candidatus Cloacimonadota bacterium]
MGKTIIEKILQNHSEQKVEPGKIVWIDIDIRTARDFGGPNVVKNLEKYYPDTEIPDKSNAFFTFDTVVPAKTIPYANSQQICRDFAKKHGLKVYDVNAGIGTHILMEKGFALPGKTLVGTDSHFNILGAVGAFGQGMGDQDIAFAFITGRNWFEVPETIKINLKGTFSYPTTGKDLVLYILRKIGSKGVLGKSVEYYGECLKDFSFSEVVTLSSMTTEMGGIIAYPHPNENVKDWLKEHTGETPEFIYADEDAKYLDEMEIDVSNLKPQIAAPPKPDNVFDVEKLKGQKVDSVFVGSCTNGRIEDMRLVADIIKGKKIADDVMLRVVPTTSEVYGQMLSEGLIKVLYNAGAVVSNPGCGGCANGQIGMTGKGEVQISTGNRNFTGKQGYGDTYLASPVTAARAALKGSL